MMVLRVAVAWRPVSVLLAQYPKQVPSLVIVWQNTARLTRICMVLGSLRNVQPLEKESEVMDTNKLRSKVREIFEISG